MTPYSKGINTLPNFDIKAEQPLSRLFVERNLLTFQQAALFIRQLPYGRNANKNELSSLFQDNCGTCSTKHAVLKQLALENGLEGLLLLIGLFKMNEKNTPKIAGILKANQLDHIPEAHCYLKYHDTILDYTTLNSSASDFEEDLIEAIEINPDQVGDYKVNYHKAYLTKWLEQTGQDHYTIDSIWKVREQCIERLAG